MSSVPALSSESLKLDYLKLLVTQLQNQNPLEPMENTEFTAQLAQMSQLEQLENLNSSFASALAVQQQSLSLQQLGGAAGLVGKEITYKVNDQTQSGKVEQVNMSDGAVSLQVNGASVSVSNVLSVK
jgi:flagellar basal-body rod modification protein FlgD